MDDAIFLQTPRPGRHLLSFSPSLGSNSESRTKDKYKQHEHSQFDSYCTLSDFINRAEDLEKEGNRGACPFSESRALN